MVTITWGRMDLEHGEVARELIMQGLFVPCICVHFTRICTVHITQNVHGVLTFSWGIS